MEQKCRESNLISVIVPVYNTDEFLPRCLDSILRQTHQNLEIIAIDDGSTDKTAVVLDEYARRDNRLNVYHQENRGLAATRERGIALSTGQFIGFVDSDDEIEPDMYERLLFNMKEYKADISECNMLLYSEDGRDISQFDFEGVKVYEGLDGLKALLQKRIKRSLCNKLYKSTLFTDSCPDTSIDNNEDLLRNYKLFYRSKRNVTDDFTGYHYWRRKGSMSSTDDSAEAGWDIMAARRFIFEDAPAEVIPEALECYVKGLFITWNMVKSGTGEKAETVKNECMREIKRIQTEVKEFDTLPDDYQLYIKLILISPALYEAVNCGRINVKLRK